jgi:hypothetical protein
MSDGMATALKIIAALAIVGVIITLGYMITSGASKSAVEINEGLNQKVGMLAEAEYDAYDETSANGSTLVSLIRSKRSEGGSVIIVVTTNNGTTQYISSGSVAGGTYLLSSALTEVANPRSAETSAKDENSSTYINPVGMFECHLIYDSNDSLRGVYAIQQ